METIQEEEIKIIEESFETKFAKVESCGLSGINAYPVEIEIDISGGLPHFILVGLPDIAVNESRERVRSAIKASSFEFPRKKIVVNLAPADTKKAGPNYDLPIAIGILAGTEFINKQNLENLFITGELGLSGKVRSVSGVLSYTLLAKKLNAHGIIIPLENIHEASIIDSINIYPVSTLSEAVHIINNLSQVKPHKKTLITNKQNKEKLFQIDFNDVKGQILAKKAVEISASGNHHLLLIGPPGVGKSMIAERLNTILPPFSEGEKIEVAQIYSASGKLKSNNCLITERPFRSPHHSISAAGLIGGGTIPMPGEISLAHKGILFLDELTEFQKQVLNSMRQALEAKEITISRSRKSITFPCDFTLIAACNPCPCGYYGDTSKKCICNQQAVKKYLSKLSGPLLDRIDLQVEMKRLSEEELFSTKLYENSDSIKKRVLNAIEIQNKRYKNHDIECNSKLTPKQIKEFCKVTSKAGSILKEAIKSFNLTGRSYDRVLKVSRTIADLDNSQDIIKEEHILEALQFRLNTAKN